MATKEKTKMRLTSLDITVLVAELKNKLIGMRISNIYNSDPKTYLFKFTKSEEKEFLIIENGLRFNLTDDNFPKSKMPSGFTMKFRKFLRSRRLEAIEQIGVERVVVLTFGQESHKHFLILELYAQGNIILTDASYKIIQLMRQHQFTEEAKVAPGEIYPFEHTCKNYIEKFDTSDQFIIDMVAKNNQEEKKEEEQEEKEEEKEKEKEEQKQEQSKKKQKQKKQKQEKQKQEKQVHQLKAKEVLFKLVPCLHAQLTDDILKKFNINPNQKVTDENVFQLKEIADYAIDYVKKFQKIQVVKGYLVASTKYIEEKKNHEEQKAQEFQEFKIKYFDVVPELSEMHQGKYIEETKSFNDAIERYFKVFDRSEDHKNYEEIAWKKFENIKQDQENRIKKLITEQDQYIRKAQLIENNIHDTQAIIDILQKMVDGGIPWDKICKMINESKKEGDPLANMIYEMNFKNSKISILLGEDDADELTPIELNITLSAYQNARYYYEWKKKFGQKEKKTKEAAQVALKQAEKTAHKEIEKEKIKEMKVQNQRRKYWFEKYYWFISTDGYLVISGKDVQQNELIVKKYLDKDDLYMHADIYGSASTIIKNPEKKQVPDTTLMQAAIATICRSKAWEQKVVVSAWWVYADQVSKSAPSGMFVGAGSFMIYGKKNFLYPTRLEMGFTMLFALDQESVAKHADERKKKLKEADQNEDNEEFKEEQEEQSNQSLSQVDEVKAGEVTVVQINPNARKIQLQNDKRQKEKQYQQQKKEEEKQQKSKQKLNAKEVGTKKEEEEEDLEDQKQIQQGNVRRKKNKLRKMKEKYADQSDEEREIKMKLLGTKEMKGQKKKKQKKQQEEDQKEDEEQQQQEQEQKVQEPKNLTEMLLIQQNIQLKNDQKEQEEIDKEKEEKKDQEEEKDEDEKNNSEDEEEAQKQQKVEEEDENLNYENEYKEMQKLVSYLYSDDNFVALVPMCAPYPVVSHNKFKMRISPGSLKRGKAAKEILNYFVNQKDSNNYEKKLIKGITDEEMINQLLGQVKLQGAGMLQLKQKEKREKKEKNKVQEQQQE